MYTIDERRLSSFGPAISTLIEVADQLKNKADADWTCKADKEAMRLSVNAIEAAERILLERFEEVIQSKIKALCSREDER